MSDFEDAKAYLMKTTDGVSLYDHLSEVILKVITEKPENAVDIVGQISDMVKRDRFVPSDAEGKEADQQAPSSSSLKAQVARVESMAQFKEAVVGADVDSVEDLQSTRLAWEAAGVSLSSQDAFTLYLSLVKLSSDSGQSGHIRLWGKLLGRDGDYYVAESDSNDQDVDENMESLANTKSYWVCSSIGGEWTSLPNVRPETIACTNKIRRFLTGNLGASVSGYPKFPGLEADLVRATIALIDADCALAPDGVFVADDENYTLSLNDDPSTDFPGLDGIGSWVHTGLSFNDLGRVGTVASDGDEETQLPEGWAVETLRGLDDSEWVVRQVPQLVTVGRHTMHVLRSSKWPGAYAVGRHGSGSYNNVYCGYGVSSEGKTYTPPMPPALCKEYDDSELVEQTDVLTNHEEKNEE